MFVKYPNKCRSNYVYNQFRFNLGSWSIESHYTDFDYKLISMALDGSVVRDDLLMNWQSCF